jgi:hypothetical protein
MLRVACFSHDRSMDASESYEHWHPLEWFAKDSDSLFDEYHHYRELLAQAVLKRPDNPLDPAAVRRVLDVIHLRYMVKHALAFMAEQEMLGVPFKEYWPRPEIHHSLYEAAQVGTPAPPAIKVISRKHGGCRGGARKYNLHPNFYAPWGTDAPEDEAIVNVLGSLGHYDFRVPAVTAASLQMPIKTPQPIPRKVTVSVLLCNYNDGRYLPDSLGAICNQTSAPDEVILLDDGSNDNSLEIMESFAERHPFVRVLKNETNRGVAYSINRLLSEAALPGLPHVKVGLQPH